MKIAFAGSHGTGKSTLARWLAARLEYTLIPDLSRELRIVGLYPDHGGKKVEHYAYTMFKQIRLEQANECFVSDCSLWGIVVYATSDGDPFTDELEGIVAKYAAYDRVFYLPIEMPPEKDGIRRESVDYQREIDVLYRDILTAYNVPAVEVKGTVSARKRKILNYIV